MSRSSIAVPDATEYCPLTLWNGTRFEIAVGPLWGDPIVRGIRMGETWFLDDFRPVLERLEPGDIVLDLGAHVGVFSLAAAALGCRVLSIEAAPGNAALLHESVRRNGFRDMTVIAAAVGERAGTSWFLPYGPWGMVSNPTVLAHPGLIRAQRVEPVRVPTVTVDDVLHELGWTGARAIKLDVEGSEVAAIAGMHHLLTHHTPLLHFESNPFTLRMLGETPQRLLAELQRLGYRTFQLEGESLVPMSGEFQIGSVVNCLAIKGSLDGWTLLPPHTLAEIATAIIGMSLLSDPLQRLDLALRLADAEPDLLADARVRLAISALRSDVEPAVRSVAAHINERSTRTVPLLPFEGSP